MKTSQEISQSERLAQMKGKTFIIDNQEATILNYAENTGDDGDITDIYLSDGRTLSIKDLRLEETLNKFVPVAKQAIVLMNRKIDEISSVSPTVLGEMRDTIVNQIRKLKETPTPEVIMQSKQIFQGVNTLTSLAKTEMSYHSMLSKEMNK